MYVCTADNPRAKASGLSYRADAQTRFIEWIIAKTSGLSYRKNA